MRSNAFKNHARWPLTYHTSAKTRRLRMIQSSLIVQKSSQQALRNTQPVCGGGADIADGIQLRCQGLERIMAFADGSLRAEATQRNWSHAAVRDSHIFFFRATHSGKAYFRNRLGLARSYFSELRAHTGRPAGQADAGEQFIRSQECLFISSVESTVRDPARTANRREFNLGIIDEKHGRSIRGWRCVDDVAPQSAPVLGGDSSRLGSGRGKKRER